MNSGRPRAVRHLGDCPQAQQRADIREVRADIGRMEDRIVARVEKAVREASAPRG